MTMKLEQQILKVVQATNDTREKFKELIEKTKDMIGEGADDKKIRSLLKRQLEEIDTRLKELRAKLQRLQDEISEE